MPAIPAILSLRSANDADVSCFGQSRAEEDLQYLYVVSTTLSRDRIMKSVTNKEPNSQWCRC